MTPYLLRKDISESEIHPDDDPAKKKKRRLWVKPWLQRKNKNVFDKLIQEMRLDDDPVFYDFHGMNKENFDKLLSLVSPHIQKENTKLRDSIPSAQRLSVTLRYLATGKIEFYSSQTFIPSSLVLILVGAYYEHGMQHGNSVFPGAGALPVTAYIHYIAHSFVDGNNAKTPF